MNKRIRVFMVDDNKKFVESVKEYFSSHAVIDVVDWAYDGEEALEKISGNYNNYDVLVMDLIIPKMDGLSVLEELNKRNIHLKSIVTTGINSIEVINKCMQVGVNYYLLKPYSFDALAKHMETIMESRKDKLIVNESRTNVNPHGEKTIKRRESALGLHTFACAFRMLRLTAHFKYSMIISNI